MKDITKKYSNGEVTIIWKPSACIHSKLCWDKLKGLPQVFDPSQKPWIKPEKASTEKIIEQIKKCPSGALSYTMHNSEENTESVPVENTVEVAENGPLLIYGNLEIKLKDGSLKKQNKVTAFCRCGASSNKPFCDGTHRKIGFQG
jgi:uncharacterized Fe-S cluster protein YjdI